MEQFRALMATLLELDAAALSPETRLNSLREWDSMSRVLFVAMVDAEYHRQVRGQDVAAAKTVQDLYQLVA
jgi:acyl carrier protein